MELKLPQDLAADFEVVLRHCALPGAERGTYSHIVTAEGTNSSLKYFDVSDAPIGDDRDYDILKSCFNRLDGLFKTLAKRLIEDPTSKPNIEIVTLSIDLDFVSGQMSVSGR